MDIKKKRLAAAGLTICIVLGLMIIGGALIFKDVPQYATFTENRNEEQFIYNIWSGYQIDQEFTGNHDFEFITLWFSDHELSMQGKTQFIITQTEDGQVVCNVEMNNNEIHYWAPVKLYIEGGGKEKQRYHVTIISVDTGETTALGIYGYIPDDEEESTCVVNGEVSEYAVGIGTHAVTRSYQIQFIFVLIMLAVMFAACIWCLEKSVKPEILFLSIAIPMGLIFLSFLNVNIVHDGWTHLTNVYKYSNIITGMGGQDENGIVYLTEGEIELFDDMDNFYVLLEKMGERESKSAEKVPFLIPRYTSADSILEYLPHVIGISIGRILRLSPMMSVMLSKMMGFLFYILLCTLAIKTSPILKRGFAVAAVLPMNLYQATGITYDAVITPVAFLITALILKARQQQLSRKEWIGVFILSAIMGSSKGGIYIPILLLLAFVPSAHMGGIKKKIRNCFVSWLIAGGSLLLTYRNVFHDFFFSYEETKVVQDIVTGEETIIVPMYNIGYVFTNPFGFLKLLIKTLFERLDYYIGSMIGNRMAWTDYETYWFIIIGFIVMLALAIAWEESENGLMPSLRERAAAGGLLLCELVGFHALMLVETKVGAAIISGVQGRYLLPFIPLVMFCLYSKSRVRSERAGNRDWCILAVLQILYVIDFITIVYGAK